MKGEINIEIKVIGSNCSNGIKLKKELKRAISNSDLEIYVTELNDSKDRKKYSIQNVPALVINGSLISEGKVLTERELSKIFISSCLE
ncbi:MAG: thioredoxin family protein [Firmicutes bacterium]|nr:thioredoxin family protein [Bacillota bacterium]